MTTHIHLLPERDKMMAETYTQGIDGSANPTGEAQPETIPTVHEGFIAKVVEKPEAEKPKGASRASTKAKKKS